MKYPTQPIELSRRAFLRRGVAGFALFAAGGLVSAQTEGAASSLLQAINSLSELGPLLPPDANGVRLPAGFQSRIVARSGARPSGDARELWHDAPDGGAVFGSPDGGWVYVSNSEMTTGGGVRALKFDASGKVVDCYKILDNTSENCAGGATPWGTWLSCEEHPNGRVFECDPQQPSEGIVRPLLGKFKHEAVAVDLSENRLYLTEDERDGRLYRFTATNGLPDLTSGVLEVAALESRDDKQWVVWIEVPDPLAHEAATRHQVPQSQAFNGGEGIAFHEGVVYFTTKRDNRVWAYQVASQELEILYDIETAADPLLAGVDNLTVTPRGEVLVAEDGGDMQVVVLTPGSGAVPTAVVPLLQVVGHDDSEITGPAFDPSFTRLYFSSQRGASGDNRDGVTFEITRA
ncbi:MAG: DUF839 domain-containing protein [Gammaproteobacteria bacterium]|jgi:secreted PhoX family phosphatase|nr:DUF839 domain-containing protein [Gammaproteobacteria bacterium]